MNTIIDKRSVENKGAMPFAAIPNGQAFSGRISCSGEHDVFIKIQVEHGAFVPVRITSYDCLENRWVNPQNMVGVVVHNYRPVNLEIHIKD